MSQQPATGGEPTDPQAAGTPADHRDQAGEPEPEPSSPGERQQDESRQGVTGRGEPEPEGAPKRGDMAESAASAGESASAESSAASAERSAVRPHAVVFRVPATALLAVGLLALCVSPFAMGSPALLLLFLVPVVLAVWVVRTRTRADRDGLIVHTMFRRRTIPWSRIASLRLTGKSGVRAVLDGDSEVALPAVRVRHLPLLAAVSDGRIADPKQPRPNG